MDAETEEMKSHTTKGGIHLSDWAREELYKLRAEIVARNDSRYDNQFIKLLNILMEPPHVES